MNILIAAGGTGGHIYPAIALAEKFIVDGNDVTFIGSKNRMEATVIPEKGYKYIGISVLSTSGSIINKFKSLISIYSTYKECLKIVKDYDLVVGFGNYISVPVVLAANKLKIKTVIHEQNSFVGRANLFLDKKVDLVIGSYKENLKQFKNKNTFILGNPQAGKASKCLKDGSVIKNLGLDPNKKTVVIFMGSLGSLTVNSRLIEFFKIADGSYQIVYATGSSYYKTVKDANIENDFIKVFERIDGMNVMKNATLLVSRAGATTLAEICAMGVPSILIPSPYVPNNHQYHNAMALVNNNAACFISEDDLSADTLDSLIKSIINDESKLASMHKNALSLSNENVLEDISEKIYNLC